MITLHCNIYWWCVSCHFHTGLKDETLDLKHLISRLNPVTAQWHAIGIQLGVDPNRLAQFQAYTAGDVNLCLSEVIKLWRESDPPPKTQHLIDALRDLSRNVLANKLEKDYKGKCECTWCNLWLITLGIYVGWILSIFTLDLWASFLLCKHLVLWNVVW